jgi:hypothetical protein
VRFLVAVKAVFLAKSIVVFGWVNVPLRDADVGVPRNSRKGPHITTALSKTGEERVPDGIHLERT